MNRKEAIVTITKALSGNELVISANGLISRDLCAARDSENNFYMLGSMGLASSIGLGVALSCSKRKVVILDGDGNILMNLGSLTTAANRKPANFLHIVLDNESYESTGGQPTVSSSAHIDQIAKAAGYRRTSRVCEREVLYKTTKRFLKLQGPTMILVKMSQARDDKSPRVPYSPENIHRRFRELIAKNNGKSDLG